MKAQTPLHWCISASTFLVAMGFHMPRSSYKTTIVLSASPKIDMQSDRSQYGRGDFHLSATLKEGDLVVYQSGSWKVDGVTVGDGTPPQFRYAKIETIQLVWTHNCEHGVLRGVLMINDNNDGQIFHIVDPLVDVEFGPEQLVAKLPVVWDGDNGRSLIPVNDSMWTSVD